MLNQYEISILVTTLEVVAFSDNVFLPDYIENKELSPVYPTTQEYA